MSLPAADIALRPMLFAIAPIAGLALGSFANVLVYRLPRRESLVAPRSRCPECGTQVRAYDNLPVVSWLLLRGHCRDCGARISPRYPVVEATMALLWVAVVLAKGSVASILLGLAFVTLLVPVALIDLEHRIIPNRLLAPGAVVGVAILALAAPSSLPEHLIAGGAAGLFFLLAVLAYPRGMGMGDVKLAAVMGLYLGRSVAPALLVALIAGTLVGAVIIARKGAAEGRKTAVPFGPFLALGGIVALFAGATIVDWYLRSFT
jgi:leader peptidase (prepilin peptidase)/N-methyltransferase